LCDMLMFARVPRVVLLRLTAYQQQQNKLNTLLSTSTLKDNPDLATQHM